MAALGGRIYAVGGHDGRAYLDSVEAYDPHADEWSPVMDISTCRAGAGEFGNVTFGIVYQNEQVMRLLATRTDVSLQILTRSAE